MRAVFHMVLLTSLSSELVVCLLCDGAKDCFGGYPSCCSGYCKKTCNMSCTLSTDCGSLGHLQEKCCNNRCVKISSVCPNVNRKKSPLDSTHIAVLISCVVVFTLVGTCALVMYVCKCGYFHARRRSHDYTQGSELNAERTWKQKLCECIKCKTSQDNREVINASATVSTETWVGRDFLVATGSAAHSNRSTEVYNNLI